jgi:hypothetical protein
MASSAQGLFSRDSCENENSRGHLCTCGGVSGTYELKLSFAQNKNTTVTSQVELTPESLNLNEKTA